MGSTEITRRVVFRPRARLEITEAVEWHKEHGLAADFLHSVDGAISAIQERPFLYQVIKNGIRRAPLKRFPYGLMYFVGESELVILTCFHDRRDPRAWRGLAP